MIRNLHALSALIFSENRESILMVKTHAKGFRSTGASYWTLPGGKFDPEATSLKEALAFKVMQETGLELYADKTEILYRVHRLGDKFGPENTLDVTMCLCQAKKGIPTTDYYKILEVREMPFKSALQEIPFIPDRSYSEPLLHYLKGGALQKQWRYEYGPNRNFNLVHPVSLMF